MVICDLHQHGERRVEESAAIGPQAQLDRLIRSPFL